MDLLEQLIDVFAQHGYAAVFVALLLCGMGLPLPEDLTLVAGGAMTGLGHSNVNLMAGLSLLGVLLGDATMFLLGHHYGARVMRWPLVARLLTPARYAGVQQKFERYGNRMLFFARFLPGMRAAIYLTAGTTHRVSIGRFLLLDGAAAVISVPIWVYLGYLGANNRAWLAMWIHRSQAGMWLLGAAIVLLALYGWWRHVRHRRDDDAR